MAKVMLIEDDVTMVSLLTTLLEMEDFEVIVADGEQEDQVIQSIAQEKPDMVLMDVHLRFFNGMDVLSKIRSNPDLSGIAIMMSSGLDVREECLKAGANDFIIKPYMPDELIKRMRKALTEASAGIVAKKG